MSDVVVQPVAERELLLTGARAFAERIPDRLVETEELRSLPAASISDMFEAGFARALVPARFGGNQLDWEAAFEAIRIVGMADASHAWCAGLLMEMAQFAGYLSPEAQEAVWADGPDVAIASTVIPSTKIEIDGDGYRLTGAGPFTSGVNHADWAFVAGMVPRESGPDWSLFLVPSSDYEVKDTWNSIGMRGTGSNTVVTDGTYVPATHMLRIADLRDGAGAGSSWHDAPLYRLPWLSFGPLVFIAPMLGAAQGAYQTFADWTRTRVTKTGSAMADLPTIQLKLANAAANIDAAELLLRRAVAQTLRDEPPTIEQRARSGRDFWFCGQRLTEAADLIMGMAGSAGFAESNAIQRYWRDIHMMATHISMNDGTSLHWARMELGLGLQPNQVQY